ncbi:MAG: serine hydrolase [Lachnospiraceae bacterium]|nr:serine hydrolase [Lachnospiraceae bacterium]
MSREGSGERKTRKSSINIALAILILTIGVAIASVALIYLTDPRKRLYGTWSTDVEMGSEAHTHASVWLSSAVRGAEIDMSGYMDDITVATLLRINDDGTWSYNVDEGSYAAAKEQAYNGMAAALKALVVLRAQGYGVQLHDDEAAENLICEKTGMSSVEYLKSYGPVLVTNLDSLREQYDKSGTFLADRDRIIINDELTVDYMVNNRMLAIDGVGDNDRSVIFRKEDHDISDISHVSAATKHHRILEDLPVIIDDKNVGTVRAIHYEYRNNRFLSLRDMAVILGDTSVSFLPSISATEISLKTGISYEGSDRENVMFGLSDEYVTDSLKPVKFTVDGKEVKYFTLIGDDPDGRKDAFISLTDLAMILDTDMYMRDGKLYIEPDVPFIIDEQALDSAGFYHEVRSALLGDATTTQIFVEHDMNTAVSIASTTKLMNYLCVMDAIASGEVGMDDEVEVTHEAEILSGSGDGVIAMKEGEKYSVKDLLYGMLLPSSNECAMLLAEHVSGSEEEFTGLMNDKAAALGLSPNVRFYNCHGLPEYSDDVFTSKLQNQMTAADMFRLCSYLLAVYPQITDITSSKEYRLSSGVTVQNSNPMLYNLPDVVGLKTGTTNMAGSSLVCAMKVTDDAGREHMVVAIEYGAEDVVTRNTISELLLRYGADTVKNRATEWNAPSGRSDIPATAEGLIRFLFS